MEHLFNIDPDVRKLILTVANCAKELNKHFVYATGLCNSENIYGEAQLELDKFADNLFTESLEKTNLVRNIASEEQGSIKEILRSEGSWGVTLDPLDGSSCVKTNLAVGTIVGMFNEGNVLEKGNRMDAACFVLYGPLTTLTYAYKGFGAHEFVLDPIKNDFILRRESIEIPEGKIYSPGGLPSEWTDRHTLYVKELERQGFKLRYSGSLTADFNQILCYGGIFMYPSLREKPEGKLRLLFEANPLAFITKEAKGYASNGNKPILDIRPEKISQRVPLYIGSRNVVKAAEEFLNGGLEHGKI
ncbi:MAG: fructose-1,6-bisphosphatase [Candidatus Diapherotrites archaeon]|nr:fructose-1,6-bisphosphatase [Candidatus Diapherotrites archaeon]